MEENPNHINVTVTETTTVTFDFYSCEEAVKRLNDYLDHELDAGERQDVMKHLTICKPCLERFRFEENLLVQLSEKMKRLCAPQTLRNRLSSILSRER